MKCFYHSADLDGHCSGAIVKACFPECEMIGINYGDEFPWKTITNKMEQVFMVDFSLQPFVEMLSLDEICDLTWIDHHKSAMEEYEKEGVGIHGVRRIGIGACQLVWEYLHPEVSIPKAIKLLAEYDVWNHTDPDTLPFQYGIRQYETLPEEQHFWKQLFEIEGLKPLDQIIAEGDIILNYNKGENRKYATACAFETELDNLRCITINKMMSNSQLFDSIWNPERYDAMLTFGFRNGVWNISLYSTKDSIDVSEVAKSYGGGGHKNAAAFQCNKLPFELK